MRTWTCKCRRAQLRLREIRMVANGGAEDPKWIYECGERCGVEAVAVPMEGSGAPLFSWLLPAADDDSDLPGRVATPEEMARLGDLLADNTARDEEDRRVVWQ